jgi:hypothetical protein
MQNENAAFRHVRSGFLLFMLMAMTAGAAKAQQAAQPSSATQKPENAPGEKAQVPAEKGAQKQSTPEDRQRLVAVAHKLEAAPLDQTLGPDRAWAVQWAVAAPDVPVRTCTSLLADLRRPRYKYRSQMMDQLLISSAAFLLEHPEQGQSIAAQSVGGMEGVLKAYTAILKADPQATAKPLDDLLQKQKEGKLAETVQEMVKGCK